VVQAAPTPLGRTGCASSANASGAASASGRAPLSGGFAGASRLPPSSAASSAPRPPEPELQLAENEARIAEVRRARRIAPPYHAPALSGSDVQRRLGCRSRGRLDSCPLGLLALELFHLLQDAAAEERGGRNVEDDAHPDPNPLRGQG